MNYKVCGFLWVIGGCILWVGIGLGQEPIELEADYLVYNEKEKSVLAEGKVKIIQGDTEIQCEKINYSLASGQFQTPDKIILKEKNMVLNGEKGEYNFKSKTGTISKGYFSAPPWYGKAKEIQKNKRAYILKNGWLSTCDLIPPHYKLVSKKMKYYPRDKFTCFNMLFMVGKVPLFYFPFYWRDLKPSERRLRFQAGSNTREGEFLKVRWRCPIKEEILLTLLGDYFIKKGLGGGVEGKYNFSKFYGELYSYYIEEKNPARARHSVKYEHWQKLPRSFTLRTNLDFTSDHSFNYDYRRDYWLPKIARRKSHLALTKSSPFHTFTLSGQRWDAWDEKKNNFVPEDAYTWLPRIDFALFPYKIGKTPFYWKCSEKLSNYYAGEKEQYRIDNNSDLNLFAQINVFKWLTLSPEVSFANRLGVGNDFYHSTSTTCYSTILKTSLHAGRFARLQVDYRYGKTLGGKSARNKMDICLQNIFPRGRVRFSTGYDFKKEHKNLEKNFDNLIGDIKIGKIFHTDFYFRDLYQISTFWNQSLEAGFESSVSNKFDLAGRLNYFSVGKGQPASAGQMDFNGGIGFWPTEHWKVQLTTRYDLINKEVKEQRLKIYRDLHCWEAKFSFRKTPLEEEFWFWLNIKAFPKQTSGIYHHLQKNEWKLLGRGQEMY